MKLTKGPWIGISALAAGLLFAPPIFAQANNGASGDANYNASSSAAPTNDNASAENSTTNSSGSTTESVKESTENAASKVKEGTKKIYHHVKRDVKDAALEARIKKALFEDHRTRHEEIHVAADRGIVMLTGAVDSRTTAEHAQEVVARLDGVRDVKNDLVYPSTHVEGESSKSAAISPSAGTTKPPYSSTARNKRPVIEGYGASLASRKGVI
jgi:hypothetical protein